MTGSNNKVGLKSLIKRLFFFAGLGIVSITIVSFCAWILITVVTVPDVINFEKCYVAQMNNIKVCPGGSNYVRLNNVSDHLKNAVVISEDSGFWHHNGLDWHELKVSFKVNLRSGRFKRGGSTITQQLVKNVYFSGNKTLTRKIKEAILAIRLEEKFSKNIILERYLNTVEFGPELYGLVAASQHYFSKPPAQLNVLESAWLAFLLPNPKGYYENFQAGELTDFAKKMILLISKRLYFYGKIDSKEYSHAKINIDRFPWYGVTDYNHAEEDDPDLLNMNEDTLEKEFERLIEEDIPESEPLSGAMESTSD